MQHRIGFQPKGRRATTKRERREKRIVYKIYILHIRTKLSSRKQEVCTKLRFVSCSWKCKRGEEESGSKLIELNGYCFNIGC